MTSIENIEINGFIYNHAGHQFSVLFNQQLDQDSITQIQRYVPNWYPTPTPGFMTFCVHNTENKVGVYQVDRIVNLFSIYPRMMTDISHIKSHIEGILLYLYELIKKSVSLQVANEIRFKVAYYSPREIINVPFSQWPGDWRCIKTTIQTICGTLLPAQLSEYAARWTFDDNYRIKETANIWNINNRPWTWNKMDLS
ncbi:hypothetical protein LCGC14_2164600 [marine sediment metagenome]|uniref:Uncharacterized protein n=2 Tax=root TaxID=1 RepID=A0A0F9G4I8_9ZZZZ|nr:MAG: hypothetical protein LCMAC202_05820 [Marseillevirus LCMAC202]